MFVLTNFLWALTDLLDWLFQTLVLVIVVRAVLSWVNADPYNGLVRAIVAISDPLLRPFRRLIPPWRTGGLDFSPLLAIVSLEFIRSFLVPTLRDLINHLR